MTDAVTSPGSRNAPLVLTLAAADGVRALSVIDERAAGFVALGLAKASGRPVAVTCTSGSAAANLMPAVVEAAEARVPLIVLTADRPPELREVGAGQSIDQVKLYGDHAAWFVEVGNHEPSRATAVHHRALACRAWWTAREAARPVHLNWPLREPLAPVPEELDAADWAGRPDGSPWVAREPVNRHHTPLSRGVMSVRGRRGAVVAGSGAPPEAAAIAERLRWPLLADALSGLRGPGAVAHYDVLLRVERFADEQRPDFVLRFGDLPTSKPLRAWLAGVEQWAVDPLAKWQDPTHEASVVLSAAPEGGEPADPGWLDSWRRADGLVPEELASTPDPFEPKVWSAVAEAAPPDALLWVASSMPIRDVEAFVPAGPKPLRFMSNRGANGIDGTIASAAGAALAHGGRTYVLLGDVALVHDIGGLLAARRLGIDLTVVCANNGGGNIFDYLPVAGTAEREVYENHILTPTGVRLERVAALADMEHVRTESPAGVAAAVERGGPLLVEAPTDRARNVELHRELVQRVAARL
jgi:2-succinyl-5-enolpyruvyl-6-hydroxy-3-cyclohexene-1-carboxylate synthase